MNTLTGTWPLTRVALRRDRIRLPLYAIGFAAFAGWVTYAYDGYFSTPQDLAAGVRFYAGNPATRMFGLASGDTLGAYTMVRTFTMTSLIAGILSILFMVRHTRQNEDTGRTELVRAGVVGRHAGLAAAMIVVLVANALLALLVAGGYIANGLPVSSAFAASVAIGSVGLTFALVAAVTAQLASASRPAIGLAAAALGGVFLTSSVGSMLGTVDAAGVRVESLWVSWLSPMGWAQHVRPFGGDHWWVLAPILALCAVLVLVAFALENRRDVGRGMIPERPGSPRAARALLSPLGLAWRLQRGVFFAWAAGVALFAGVFGAMTSDMERLVEEWEGGAAFFEHFGGSEGLTDAYFAMVLSLLGMVASVYAVQVLLRMRGEEGEGPLESLLATAVSRPRWALSHVTMAVVGTAGLLLVGGISMGLVGGIVLQDVGGWLGTLAGAALLWTPAALVIAGFAIAAFGLLPRRAVLVGWLAFAVALLVGPMFGALLDLPERAQQISPFSHVPLVPAEEFSVAPVAVLLALGVALAAIGLLAFRRRDLALHAGG